MDESILNTVKKVSGIEPDYTHFDLDILMLINSAFSTLHQLGVGPEAGLMITDATPTWAAFLGDDVRLNSVKTYVCQKVRLVFDPPATSYLVEATKAMLLETEWRLNVVKEGDFWYNPEPDTGQTDVLDGGSPDTVGSGNVLEGGTP